MASRANTTAAKRTPARSTPRRARRPAVQRPTVAKEWLQLERTLDLFERLTSIAGRESRRNAKSRAAADMEQLAWQYIREADPIRVSHAEKLLGMSNQTVRSWIDEGILDAFGGSPQRIGLESVVRAKQVADELREEGRDRDFMSAVLSRLEALALEKDKDFRKSVRQMRRRERRPRPY